MSRGPENREDPSSTDSPPVFSTWGRLYAAVLASLAIMIILMVVFMETYS